ncbi:hypothetical protein GCK72_017348 [Caenorhabditis remanei]|uniref:Uncharacterized protein n=1 Tax=Caenorhabditis remanei TaxID=31234 RepID=A0A6A5G723_CAERE|nr:hypothetical protein GCK72_017348 [Caenorhabditis remanei]KAF1750797.1 hypothetical protein GCK72_017348 [Caenorhabditis remanei]
MPFNKPQSFLHYVRYAQLVAQLGFFSTAFFCFILVFLTMFGNVYSNNAGYILFSTSRPFNMSQYAVTWFIGLYAGVYSSTISMLSVQFLYRYWAVFELEMMQKYSTDFSEIAGVALVAYDKDGNIRWFNICSTLNHTFIMLIQYSVIIYCGIWMYIEMDEKVQMLSLSLRNLHKQFFKTLILQIVTPTITLFSPVMLIIYLPLLDLECDLPTGIFLSAVTLYPAMDAIIVMYIVSDYKKAAKTMLKKALDRASAWLNTVETDQSSTRTRSTATNRSAALNRKMLKNALEQTYTWLSTVETDQSSTRTRSTAANLPAALNKI